MVVVMAAEEGAGLLLLLTLLGREEGKRKEEWKEGKRRTKARIYKGQINSLLPSRPPSFPPSLPQVILSLQLSFAVFPLIIFTGDISIMGPAFVNSPFTSACAWISAVLIAILNIWLLVMTAAQGGVPS